MERRTEYVGSTLPSTLGPGHTLSLTTCLSAPQFRNFKIIYRRYAGLYFCICVDVNDNNLAYLEAIHNFVEVRRQAGAVPRVPSVGMHGPSLPSPQRRGAEGHCLSLPSSMFPLVSVSPLSSASLCLFLAISF